MSYDKDSCIKFLFVTFLAFKQYKEPIKALKQAK